MKKYIFIISAAVLAFACAKEIEVITDIDTPVEEVTASSTDIPQTLTAFISDKDTKTAYDADGKFTWLDSDQVRLLVCEDLSTYSKQGIYSYRVKSLSADSKTAVFTSTSSAGDLTAFVDGTWKSTGIAMYPASALDRFNTPESHSYGTPWFTLARGNVSGLASDILLTGMALSDNSNFKFSTAMAVLKVTVENIPADTDKLKLCTSDKNTYPVDGDFALAKDNNEELVKTTFLTTWVSSFKGYQAVDLSSEGEIASRDFYFNIPANTYPAGTLSIRLEDSNGSVLMLRTINKALTLERNDCLDIPTLYYHRVYVKGSVTNPKLYTVNPYTTIRTHIATTKLTSANYNSSEWADGNKFGANQNGWDLTGLKNTGGNAYLSTSGSYYLQYVVCSSDTKPTALSNDNVVTYGSVPFKYDADGSSFNSISDVLGSYNVSVVDYWNNKSSTSIVIAASDDSSKGNVMITNILSHDTTIYGTYQNGVISFDENQVWFVDGNSATHRLINNWNGTIDSSWSLKVSASFDYNLHLGTSYLVNEWFKEENKNYDAIYKVFDAVKQ